MMIGKTQLYIDNLPLRGLIAIFVFTAVPYGCKTKENDSIAAPATQASACPTEDSLKGPTIHGLDIAGNETWSALDSPHIVLSKLNIPEQATLTIESCVRVRFSKDAGIALTQDGATLIVKGEPGKEVKLEPSDTLPWSGIEVEYPGKAELHYAHLTGAGSNEFLSNATLHIRGTGTTPRKTPVLVDHVKIDKSKGAGVILERVSAFADGSQALTLVNNGAVDHPYPIVVGEHGMHRLPTGSYTNNFVDEILIVAEGADASGGLRQDTTVLDRGIPYRTAPYSSIELGLGNTSAVLTLEEGVEIRFAPETALRIHESVLAQPGALRAKGTLLNPVLLTSAASTPQAGDWTGLIFEGRVDDRTLMEHLVIDYAGGYCSCTVLGCNTGGMYEAAIILNTPPSGDFLINSRILRSAGHGILRSWHGTDSVTFVDSNEFEDVRGCKETYPPSESGECPDPPPTCNE